MDSSVSQQLSSSCRCVNRSAVFNVLSLKRFLPTGRRGDSNEGINFKKRRFGLLGFFCDEWRFFFSRKSIISIEKLNLHSTFRVYVVLNQCNTFNYHNPPVRSKGLGKGLSRFKILFN